MSDMFTDAYGGDRPSASERRAMRARWEAKEARRKAEEAERKAEEAADERAERERGIDEIRRRGICSMLMDRGNRHAQAGDDAPATGGEVEFEWPAGGGQAARPHGGDGYRELLAEIAGIVGIEDAVDGKEPGEYRQLLIDRLTERLGKQGDAGQDAPEADSAQPVSEEQRRWEAWADGLVAKIDAGERLTRGEIADMVFDDGLRYDEERGHAGRWTQAMATYLRMRDGRFFCIEWEKGLTEYQENEYPCQPYEVVPHDVEKVVTERTWETVGRR